MLRKILKGIGVAVAALVALLVLAYVGVYFASEASNNKTYEVAVQPIAIPSDPAALERGKHLVTAVSDCAGCHGTNLAGGVVFADPAVGRVVAPNLTKGKNGFGGQLSDVDFVRVIRYGVMPAGRSVRVMNADTFTYLADSDLGAIIAYAKSVPPVDTDWPAMEVGPLGRVLIVTGQLPIYIRERIDPELSRPMSISIAQTAEYGQYLTKVASCVGCHGPGYSGGQIIGSPPGTIMAANLTPAGALGKWSEADFVNTIRTGVDPSGHSVDPEMPWQTYRNMDDLELKAIWTFLKTVPAKAFGGR